MLKPETLIASNCDSSTTVPSSIAVAMKSSNDLASSAANASVLPIGSAIVAPNEQVYIGRKQYDKYFVFKLVGQVFLCS